MNRYRVYQIRFRDAMGVDRIWYYDSNNCTNPYNEALDVFKCMNVEGALIKVTYFKNHRIEELKAVKQLIDGKYHITK